MTQILQETGCWLLEFLAVPSLTDWLVAIFTFVLAIVAWQQFKFSRHVFRKLERPRVLLEPRQAVRHDMPNLFSFVTWYQCINVGRTPAILKSVQWEFSLEGECPSVDFDPTWRGCDAPTRILGTAPDNSTHIRGEDAPIVTIRFDRDRALPCFRQRGCELRLVTTIQYTDAMDELFEELQRFRFNFDKPAWERS
jgi:hypothetical protein